MDRYRQIATFVQVVEAGSFVRAAAALETSKAAVSRGVLELETRLGARLLHRTTRRVALTEAGRAFYERARNLLTELAEADDAAGARAPIPAGSLRVNAPYTFGVQHLGPLWGEFLERHPKIELDITLTDRRIDLQDEGVDVAIRITRVPDANLAARRLANVRLVVCASPVYLARRGTPSTVAQLAEHDVIAYSYAPTGDVWHFDTPDGPAEVTTRARMRVNNGETCRAAALAHQGLIRLPYFVVAEDLARGTLQSVLDGAVRPDELGVFAVYPARRPVSARVRALIDFLAQAFAQSEWAAPVQADSPAAQLMPGMRKPRRK